jgi:hypothetical protein
MIGDTGNSIANFALSPPFFFKITGNSQLQVPHITYQPFSTNLQRNPSI